MPTVDMEHWRRLPCAHCPLPTAQAIARDQTVLRDPPPWSGVVTCDGGGLELIFRQFKLEVPRADWSGGQAAGVCGCLEPTSGILVSPPQASISIFMASHSSPLQTPIKGPEILFIDTMVTCFGASSLRIPSTCQAERQLTDGFGGRRHQSWSPVDFAATAPSPDRLPRW